MASDDQDSSDLPRSDDLALWNLLWPVVGGSDLPESVHTRLMEAIDRLGPDRGERTERLVERLLHVRDGLVAATYHRDRIESIEREIVRRVRTELKASYLPGTTSSMRTPVLSHEYVAYLLAARRTLDYLAGAVATAFNVTQHSIRRLATTLEKQRADDEIAQAVVEACSGVSSRFRDLVTEGDGQSERDRAAHYWPVEPVYLLIVFFQDGRIGIELRDGGGGTVSTDQTVLDPQYMTRDEPLLATVLGERLSDLQGFCGDLVEYAVDAELRRLACRR